MASIPIDNETTYALTDDMRQYILRDAHEHFGDEVRSIRVQSGLERHAFNARTHAVRYAFSPQDFGMVNTMPTTPERPRLRRWPRRIDEDTEAEILPAPFEDGATEEESEPYETSMESLAQGRDDDEEEEVFTLDNPIEDEDEEEEGSVLDGEDEEDSRSSAARERGTHISAVIPQSVLDTRALADATGGVLRKEAQVE